MDGTFNVTMYKPLLRAMCIAFIFECHYHIMTSEILEGKFGRESFREKLWREKNFRGMSWRAKILEGEYGMYSQCIHKTSHVHM